MILLSLVGIITIIITLFIYLFSHVIIIFLCFVFIYLFRHLSDFSFDYLSISIIYLV